jgi:hypothetical protein
VVRKLVGHGNPMLTVDKYLRIDKADIRVEKAKEQKGPLA